jgi:hypothetical protein
LILHGAGFKKLEALTDERAKGQLSEMSRLIGRKELGEQSELVLLSADADCSHVYLFHQPRMLDIY